jgi:hypothetical protein
MSIYEPPGLSSALGLLFFIDTHFLDDQSSAALDLKRLREEGQIALARTDVIDTELMRAPTDKGDLATQASDYPEVLGPWVLGQSRLGVHDSLGPRKR